MVEAAPPRNAHFSARLRELRGDLSFEQFGRRIGLSASAVRKLEDPATANPRLDTLLGIQRALGLASIEELFGQFPSAELAERPREAEGGPQE